MRWFRVAALLSLGCASYQQNVLDALKSQQDALRENPGTRPVRLPRANQMLGMPRALIEERLGPPELCWDWVPVAGGPGWGRFERRYPTVEACGQYEFNAFSPVYDSNITLQLQFDRGRCSGARWWIGTTRLDGWADPEAFLR